MPCYKPMLAIRHAGGVKFLRRAKNDRASALRHGTMQLPCGQCVGCRLERSRQWALRCVHESKLYDVNCFITLTYADEYLPSGKSLDKTAFQKFMKRLRKRYVTSEERKIRFYACGEYGEECANCAQNKLNCSCGFWESALGRPHFHACLFNHDFKDKKLWTVRNGNQLFVSEELAQLWPFGHSTVGALTFESAAYTARYVMKKVTGSDAADRYGSREPEFTIMSRRPGIGRLHYDKFKSDHYPNDIAVMRGKRMKPPKYYDTIYGEECPDEMEAIKAKRVAEGIRKAIDKTEKRLYAAQTVKECQLKSLRREL